MYVPYKSCLRADRFAILATVRCLSELRMLVPLIGETVDYLRRPALELIFAISNIQMRQCRSSRLGGSNGREPKNVEK